MWSDKATSRQSADRLARSLIEHRLVTVRDLPERSGRALILAAAGVRLLSEEGIVATSGKDIGRHTDQGWIPHLGWRHDLIAQGVLCELHKRGYEIYSEHQIRSWDLDLGKIPDALAVSKAATIWIEVENARKSGKEMARLANALITVAQQGVKVGDFTANNAMIAFAPSALSEAGHSINHEVRVRNAIASRTKDTTTLILAKCQMLNVGVESIKFSSLSIENERWRAIYKQLSHQRDWNHNKYSGEQTRSYNGYFMSIHPEKSGFTYLLSHETGEKFGEAKTVSEIKEIFARIIARDMSLS